MPTVHNLYAQTKVALAISVNVNCACHLLLRNVSMRKPKGGIHHLYFCVHVVSIHSIASPALQLVAADGPIGAVVFIKLIIVLCRQGKDSVAYSEARLTWVCIRQ